MKGVLTTGSAVEGRTPAQRELHGKRVHPRILWMPPVRPYVPPLEAQASAEREELLPSLGIDDEGILLGTPGIEDPAGGPLGHSLNEVRGIGPDDERGARRGATQMPQRRNSRLQFHLIIGGVGHATA